MVSDIGQDSSQYGFPHRMKLRILITSQKSIGRELTAVETSEYFVIRSFNMIFGKPAHKAAIQGIVLLKNTPARALLQAENVKCGRADVFSLATRA
jgi:hypothetical protein